ncbi:MFS general substrate transporter [Karstenula rhodostoma CBS 690.94]|uniref:MFS general substrate transporter n=1 Tax=Karstenula rhodostoma CBS 690.94 TaxID=1392251 RepID=A0A9P4PQZ4_9PLEO|nr:MFS general substrate transporter [Karstenula rhodostoma CBS 690.94]
MDIASIVYRSADVDIPERIEIYVDEKAELERTQPQPLRKPRPVGSSEDVVEQEASSPEPLFDAESDKSFNTTKRKHESYDLSGSVFLISREGKTLDLPIPSNSQHDPLNWSSWKIGAAMVAVGWYSATALTAVQAVSLMMDGIVPDYTEEMTAPWSPATLTTAPTLFMGLGCFIWVPLSLALGRRPVFLLAALIDFLAILGAGYSQTFYQLLGCVCLLGLSEGFGLSLAFLMVVDMTFIDRRPKIIARLWSIAGFFGTGGLCLVPILSEDGKEWHLFYLRWACPSLIALLLAFFLYDETYFKRPTVAFDGMILMQSATEKLTIYDDLEADSDIYRDLPSFDGEKRGLLHRLGFARSPSASWKAIGRCYLQMFFCAINPLIFWVLITSAFNFAGMMFIGATFATIMDEHPYDLPSYKITLVNLSSGTGGLLAYLFAGYLLPKALTFLSKRNRGVREAEHYLVGYIVPVIAGALSTLLYGLAVHNHWHYSMYYVSYGLNGLSYVTFSIGNTLWVTEVFPRWAAPALAVVTGGSYFLSFSISFGLVLWIEAHGYLLVGIELTVLQLAGGMITLPIAFWGKSARQKIHGKWAHERSGALRPL